MWWVVTCGCTFPCILFIISSVYYDHSVFTNWILFPSPDRLWFKEIKTAGKESCLLFLQVQPWAKFWEWQRNFCSFSTSHFWVSLHLLSANARILTLVFQNLHCPRKIFYLLAPCFWSFLIPAITQIYLSTILCKFSLSAKPQTKQFLWRRSVYSPLALN